MRRFFELQESSNYKNRRFRLSSKIIAQSELDDARVAACFINHAEVCAVDVQGRRVAGIVRAWDAEVDVIEDVEELGAKFDVLVLCDIRAFDDAEIRPEETRTFDYSAP